MFELEVNFRSHTVYFSVMLLY